MGPEEVEDFTRQRYNVPGGDFGRIKNQQNVIRGLIKKIVSGGVLTNPIKLDALLTTAAESLTVDKDLNLRSLAFAVKDISPDNVKFATVPYVGTMTTDAGSSVQLNMVGVDGAVHRGTRGPGRRSGSPPTRSRTWPVSRHRPPPNDFRQHVRATSPDRTGISAPNAWSPFGHDQIRNLRLT